MNYQRRLTERAIEFAKLKNKSFDRQPESVRLVMAGFFEEVAALSLQKEAEAVRYFLNKYGEFDTEQLEKILLKDGLIP